MRPKSWVNNCACATVVRATTYQKVVPSTTILTVPGNLPLRVNVSSISIPSSESYKLSSVTRSSVSHSSSNHGGEPEERNIPEAAAWVSVGELREADGLILFGPREFRAIKMCEGFVVIAVSAELHSKHTDKVWSANAFMHQRQCPSGAHTFPFS
jgi:hypothetical protein